MNQRTIISLFMGFTVLIGVFVLFITMYLGEQSSSPPVDAEPGFPFIYLALMVIAFGGVILGLIIRLRR
jgi:hypothetical protein